MIKTNRMPSSPIVHTTHALHSPEMVWAYMQGPRRETFIKRQEVYKFVTNTVRTIDLQAQGVNKVATSQAEGGPGGGGFPCHRFGCGAVGSTDKLVSCSVVISIHVGPVFIPFFSWYGQWFSGMVSGFSGMVSVDVWHYSTIRTDRPDWITEDIDLFDQRTVLKIRHFI